MYTFQLHDYPEHILKTQTAMQQPHYQLVDLHTANVIFLAQK